MRFVDTYIIRDFDVSNVYFYLSAKEWLMLGLHKVEGLLMRLKVSASWKLCDELEIGWL